MILLHAIEAPYDIPGIGIRRGETMYHLLSNVPGPAGTAELLAFVRACGGRDAWMQSPGTYREHFDLFGEWAERARALGAREATGHEVGAILKKKRVMMQNDAIIVPTITSRQMAVVDDLMQARYFGDQPVPPEYRFAVDELETADTLAQLLVDLVGHMLGKPLQSARILTLGGPGSLAYIAAEATDYLCDIGAQGQIWAVYHERDLGEPHPSLARETDRLSVHRGQVPSTTALARADLIIDAMTDLECSGPPPEMTREAIINANASGVPILSLDLPAGLDPNDGGMHAPCIRATATMAVGLPKRGLSLVAAQPYIGDVWLADPGYPRRIYKRVGISVGDIFAGGPLVRLQAAPLAGGEIESEVVRWQVAEESSHPTHVSVTSWLSGPS